MEIRELKSGLFGFRKQSVYEYISQLNRTCSEKVEEARRDKLAALSELSQKNEELNNRVIRLEGENDALRRDRTEKEALISSLNEQIKQLQERTQKSPSDEIAEIIAEARVFAAGLREKAIIESKAMRVELNRKNDEARLRLATYERSIAEIRAAIDSILENTKERLSETENKISEIERTDESIS